MRIQHNIMAMNAYRNYNNNTSALSKNLEKLSSGYKINRMDSLATQSANGTYDNEVDRLNLQKEVNALRSEIDRIADSSNFNGKALLNGDLDGNVTTTILPTRSLPLTPPLRRRARSPSAGRRLLLPSN